jgi:hypothetical protein
MPILKTTQSEAAVRELLHDQASTQRLVEVIQRLTGEGESRSARKASSSARQAPKANK